ncbi:MAG: hypothetical protein WCQ70_09795 [Lentimicrobiaceae bacterium]
MTKLKEIHGRKPMHEHSSSDIEEVDPIFAAWLANYVPYVHPDGFSNQPAEPLPGNTVIARININAQGHVEGIETKDIPSDLFCYMAWRDAPGDGFTLTPNNNSAFEAILYTHTEILSPIESDFEGLWRSKVDSSCRDKHYSYTQGSPSLSWSIIHNLGKYPSVTITDSSGTEIGCEVIHNDLNSLTLNFSEPFAGNAYLN